MSRAAGDGATCVQMGTSAITATHVVTLRDGTRLFGKILRGGASPRLLAEECASLEAIAATRAVRVPAIVARGERWMLLEWLEHTRAADVARESDDRDETAWRTLGSSIAQMHSVRNATYGWARDNFIGSLEQRNAARDTWPAFWREQRITPLTQAARDAGLLNASDTLRIDKMCAQLDQTLGCSELDGASLLHGDLWSGNVMLFGANEAAVFDPSCYYGHREVDLAMAALFGGFHNEFFAGYEGSYALQPEWPRRRAIYQLYYLLAHVLMFGRSYHGMVRDALTLAGY